MNFAYLVASLDRVWQVGWPGAAIDHCSIGLVEGLSQCRVCDIVHHRVSIATIHLHDSLVSLLS